MASYVFCGPSLPPAQLERLLPGALACPPIRRGDLERRAVGAGDRVLILDGYYFHVPAIQHIEIIEALRRGADIWGASSMGALRAAELDGLGMRGLGYVYDQYQRGALQGDDEVAILHDPVNYRPASDALVNLRYNLSAAVQAGALSAEACAFAIAQLGQLWFGERSYARALSVLRSSPHAHEAEALKAYLAQATVDVKHRDALAAVREFGATERLPSRPERQSSLPQTTVFGAGLRREFAAAGGLDGASRTEVLTAWLSCAPRAKSAYRRCAQLELLSLLAPGRRELLPSTRRCRDALVTAGSLGAGAPLQAADGFLYPLQIGSGVRVTHVLETYLERSGAFARVAAELERCRCEAGQSELDAARPSAARVLGVFCRLWRVEPASLSEEVRLRGFLDLNHFLELASSPLLVRYATRHLRSSSPPPSRLPLREATP